MNTDGASREHVCFMKIGIARRDEYRARTIAIAKGNYRPAVDEPKIWFVTIKLAKEAIAQGKHGLDAYNCAIEFINVYGKPITGPRQDV